MARGSPGSHAAGSGWLEIDSAVQSSRVTRPGLDANVVPGGFGHPTCRAREQQALPADSPNRALMDPKPSDPMRAAGAERPQAAPSAALAALPLYRRVAVRTVTGPLFGPGTGPFTRIRFRSASTRITSRLRTVTRSSPK